MAAVELIRSIWFAPEVMPHPPSNASAPKPETVDTVMALVLTFDAPNAAVRCVDSIQASHTPVTSVLVVDNAGHRRAPRELGQREGVRVLSLKENLGPAGGHAEGLRAFLASTCQWAWIFDDDCLATPDALSQLLDDARRLGNETPAVMLPATFDKETGAIDHSHGWWGVLLHRYVVETVGVPNEELFWWTEDTEYLQWRIPRSGFVLKRSATARVEVSRGRFTADKPAWKYYYEARNQVFHRLWVQRPGEQRPVPNYLTVRVRTYRAMRAVLKLSGRALIVERRDRARKLAMVARGTFDGIARRQGKLIDPDSSHRPSGTRDSPG